MILRPGLRKLALTAHVTSSVGWLGAALSYLALVTAALRSGDGETVRAAYLALEPTAWFGLVPLAFASVLTGLVSSLGSPWGLFRHHWVIFKLVLTIVATLVLLGNLRTVELLAEVAARTDTPDPAGLRGQILHSAGGALVLLVTTVLGIYKPRGMTAYGWRKERAGTSDDQRATATPSVS